MRTNAESFEQELLRWLCAKALSYIAVARPARWQKDQAARGTLTNI